MKKQVLVVIMLVCCISSFSQAYKSSSVIQRKKDDLETEWKDRVITISEKEISITNFLDGNTKTLHLVVNKIENKDWPLDGIQKTYYCTYSSIFGERKAIAYAKNNQFIVALFADEITISKYIFSIE